MSRLRLVPFFALGLSCASPTPMPAATPAAAPQSGLAFVDVTVIPMDSEREVPHQTVLVHDGRVTVIGDAATTKVPDGMRRIDGQGRYLLPGLADMHVHLKRGTLPLFPANGVTTVRNMSGRPRDLFWRDEIARGELFGPTIFTTGPILDGSPPDANGSVPIRSRADADAEVAREQREGYDFVKILQVLPVSAYDAIFAAARARGMRVVGHVPNDVPLAHALAMRQDSIEHLTSYLTAVQRDDSPFASGNTPRDLRAFQRKGDYVDAAKIAAVAAATRDAGVWNCPTLSVYASNPLVSVDEARAAETARFLSPAVRSQWDPSRSVWTASFQEEDWRAAERTFAARLRIVRALHDAGAQLLAGTDDPPHSAPGFSLYDELALFVRAGLHPFDALAAATRDAGIFLHRPDIGRVTPGAVADLVLVDADPLRDIRNAERRVGVAVRGQWFPEEELRTRREAVAALAAKPPRVVGAEPILKDAAGKPLPPAAVTRATLKVTVNDVDAGEEKIAFAKAHDGSFRVVADEALDDPFGAPDLSVEAETAGAAGAKATVAHLRIERGGDEEAGWLDARREGGSVVVKGHLPLAGDVSWEAAMPPDRLLLAPTIASYVLLAHRAADLAPGAKAHYEAEAFAMDGSPDDVALTLPVLATVDVTRLAAPGAFGIDVAAPNGRYHAEITLDPRGVPTSLAIDRQELEEKHLLRSP